MKKPILTLIIGVALFTWACSPPVNVLLSDLNHPRYKYLLDFDSKISQQKLRNMEGYYSKASTGIFFLDALGNSTASRNSNYYNPQHYTDMPRLFRKIKIVNEETDTLFADLITELPLNHEYSCSVRKIFLPMKKSITLVTALGEPYQFIYRWGKNSTEEQTFSFYTSAHKKLHVSKEGINGTRVIID